MKTVKLKYPVSFGSETIEELTLKPSAGAFRGFSQKAGADGSVAYAPYDLAVVAMKMAGQPNAVADKLHPADMQTLAQEVLGFLADGQTTGSEPSP